MKWVLFFCLISPATPQEPIRLPTVIESFVEQGACIKRRNVEVQRAVAVKGTMKGKSPAAYFACIPAVGPWKKEAKWQ